MNYWAGVFVGCALSFIFFAIAFFIQWQAFSELKNDFKELKTEHEQLLSWVNENEITMKTYGFLNEQITKLLEEKSRNEYQ